MAHHDDLLAAAENSIARVPGQRGRQTSAVIRRAISTAYYALFGFISSECGTRLVGTGSRLLSRRRMFVRVITHRGAKAALGKVRGARIEDDIAPFFGVVTAPEFARTIAATFADAQTQRHDADYDLNAQLSETDARLVIRQVRHVITGWQAARANNDRDFKHALCMLIVFKGKLKPDT